jgi:hypothetical protein
MPAADLHAVLLEHATAHGDERLAALIVRALAARTPAPAVAPARRAYRTLVVSLELGDPGRPG